MSKEQCKYTIKFHKYCLLSSLKVILSFSYTLDACKSGSLSRLVSVTIVIQAQNADYKPIQYNPMSP